MIDIVNILTLTQKEIRDARNNRWYVLYTVVFTALSLLLAWLGLAGLGNYGLAGFGRTAASIVNMVLLIVPLMGLTLGALSLSGERERGTLLYILSQPVSHIELLLGKYIGLAIALFAGLMDDLAGFEVYAPRAVLPELEEGEFYWFQLEGLTVSLRLVSKLPSVKQGG